MGISSIPSPNILVDSIMMPNGVTIKMVDMINNNIVNQESRMFFIEHPDIFRKYLEKIENNIPANFNTYIKNILTDIKTKNLDVDDYWLNMKAGKRRSRRTMRKKRRSMRKKILNIKSRKY